MNSNLLKSKMAEKGDTQETLASILNLSVVSTNKKINALMLFKTTEIKLIMLRYNLTPQELVNIFFN